MRLCGGGRGCAWTSFTLWGCLLITTVYVIFLSTLCSASSNALMESRQLSDSKDVGIQPHTMDSRAQQIMYCGPKEDPDTVLILTATHSVFRSGGDSLHTVFEKQNSKMPGASGLDSATGKQLGPVRMLSSSAHHHHVFFLGLGFVHWYTKDAGVTYERLVTDGTLSMVAMHPTKTDYILALQTVSDDKRPQAILTSDHGKSWRLLRGGVKHMAWTPVNHLSDDSIGTNIENRIYAVIHREAPSALIKQREKNSDSEDLGAAAELTKWLPDVDVVYSDDLFMTTTVLVPLGRTFTQLAGFLFVAKMQGPRDITLLLSSPGTVERSEKDFVPIRSIENLGNSRYSIVNSHMGVIFIAAKKMAPPDEPQPKWGSLYRSDESGSRYRSVGKSVMYGAGLADIVAVRGLHGTFLSNMVENVDEMNSLVDMQQNGDSNTKEYRYEDMHITTMMTFALGASWQRVRAPSVDATGTSYSCVTDTVPCSLHLFFADNPKGYSRPYSVDGAIGLILATGMVGMNLDVMAGPDRVNTYMSRDGGWTWEEIRRGPHIYEIGDHGGLILMAPIGTESTDLFYTFDEGRSWTTLTFSKEKIRVRNIRTEPRSSGVVFLVQGVGQGNADNNGRLYTLDFGKLHGDAQQCSGESDAGDSASDFEIWNPRDHSIGGGGANGCLMGEKIQYTRRKSTKTCYLGHGRSYKVIRKPCDCSLGDYECHPDFFGNECKPRPSAINTTPFLAVRHQLWHDPSGLAGVCAMYSSESVIETVSGYVRLPVNKCEGGMDFRPKVLYCPNVGGLSRTAWAVILFLIILAVVMGALTAAGRDIRVRQYLAKAAASAQYSILGGKTRADSATDDFGLTGDSFDDEEPQVLPDGPLSDFTREAIARGKANQEQPYGGFAPAYEPDITQNAGAKFSGLKPLANATTPIPTLSRPPAAAPYSASSTIPTSTEEDYRTSQWDDDLRGRSDDDSYTVPQITMNADSDGESGNTSRLL